MMSIFSKEKKEKTMRKRERERVCGDGESCCLRFSTPDLFFSAAGSGDAERATAVSARATDVDGDEAWVGAGDAAREGEEQGVGEDMMEE